MELTDLVSDVVARDTVRRIGRSLGRSMLIATAVLGTYLSTVTSTYARDGHHYEQQQPAHLYGQDRERYVHIPSWIKQQTVSFEEFGPNLYGMAIPSLGVTFIRGDLTGNERLEVAFHEAVHVLHPDWTEEQVRAYVRSVLGEDAGIHQHLARRHI